jgi:integrase
MLPLYRIKSAGQTYFRVDYGIVNGKRMTKTTGKRAEAERWAREGWTERHNRGIAALAIPHELKEEAVHYSDKLKGYGANITEAATYYLDHVLKYRQSPTVAEIVEKMLAEKEKLNRRPATINNLRYHLNQFKTTFGTRKLAEVTLPELQEWVLDPGLSPRSQVNRLTKASELFNYSVRHEWCSTNLTEKLDRPSVEDGKVEIFTVDEALKLLKLAPRHGLLPYVAFALFGGIRREELNRLDWPSFKPDPTIIIGPDAAKKRGQRVIDDETVWETLMPWIATCIQKRGPIVPPNFRKRLDALIDVSEVEWRQNGLRHSFGSYHLAAFKNPTLTAYIMGNSPVMVQSHYRALVTEGSAKLFWALRPGEAEKIVVMKAS